MSDHLMRVNDARSSSGLSLEANGMLPDFFEQTHSDLYKYLFRIIFKSPILAYLWPQRWARANRKTHRPSSVSLAARAA